MRITSMKIIVLGSFGAAAPKGVGNVLVTPLSILERWPERAEGVSTTPPLGALIVALTAEDGTTGYGTVGLSSGAPDVRNNLPDLPGCRWGPRHDTASPVFRAPGRASMTGIQYIAPLGLYVMPQWPFPHLYDRPNPARWQSCQWDFYQAPAPWGPWTPFFSQTFEPEGFDNPTIPSKFISPDGKRLWLLTCGDFATHAYYALHLIPMDLDLETENSGGPAMSGTP